MQVTTLSKSKLLEEYSKYNYIYRISELDRLKEKYYIKYDTEESIVEYIINVYK